MTADLTLQDGTTMPSLGLGTWKSESDRVYHAVRAAIEVGYRHIDCAAIYGNEDAVGRALSDAFSAGDVTRTEMWITSKLWNDAHGRDEVRPALEQSLRKLQLDHLDLYLIHWPVSLVPGVSLPRSADDFRSLDETPLETTWEAMLEMSADGLTRQVGVSNFTPSKIERVRAATGEVPAVNQIELHPYLQQWDVLEQCRDMGVSVTAYSPLGSPDSAKMFGRKDEVPLTVHPTIGRIAARHDATPGQVLIAWALSRGTAVIPKSANPDRIAENWGSRDLELDDDDMKAVAELDDHQRQLDASFWFIGDDYDEATFWD